VTRLTRSIVAVVLLSTSPVAQAQSSPAQDTRDGDLSRLG
jgi:hypothetical protein